MTDPYVSNPNYGNHYRPPEQPVENTLPVTAHLSAAVDIPARITPLPNGRFAIRFGRDTGDVSQTLIMTLHVTAAQWNEIDTAVRAEIFGVTVPR